MAISASKLQALGVMGGTYNPVHNGHLRAALEWGEAFALQRVDMLPCHQPVHRAAPEQSSEQRKLMLELAVQQQSHLQVDFREMFRQGPSYTLLSLQEIRREYGEQLALYFAMGTDAFAEIQQWHEWQRLFDYANIVVLHRPGKLLGQLTPFLQQRFQPFKGEHTCASGCLFELEIPALDISSSAIRAKIKQGKSISYLVPEQVERYIYQHKLYQ